MALNIIPRKIPIPETQNPQYILKKTNNENFNTENFKARGWKARKFF